MNSQLSSIRLEPWTGLKKSRQTFFLRKKLCLVSAGNISEGFEEKNPST